MNEPIRKEKLSPEEVSLLRKRLKGFIFFVFIAIGMCVFFFMVLPNDKIIFWVNVGFWVIFFSILAYGILGPVLDILTDEKWIIRGNIDNKVSRTGHTISRSIVINGKTYSCEYTDYNKVKAGDFVELYYAPKSRISFQVQVLSRNVEIENRANKPNFFAQKEENTASGEIQDSDISIINKALFKWLRFPIFAALFCFWIILGLLINKQWAIMVFLFPFPLLFLYCVFIISKKIMQVSLDKHQGLTQIIETVVLDKLVTNHKSTEFFQLKTKHGSVSVSRKVFDAINGGEVIQVIQLPRSKFLMGVINQNGAFIGD